jgi:macrolide transport system ATP-binding/permease protein
MIEFKDISRTYHTGSVDVNAVSGVSLKIESGEFVAFMGASGSGKSTLMHMMGLLDRPDAGTYLLAGHDVTGLSDDQLAAVRNRSIGFVFQQFHLLPRMTAVENVALPLVYAGHRGLQEKALVELKAVGLADRVMHRPNELSGGQQQRVAIARALVNDPFIIMADEPTGNLDTKSKDEIIGILKDLNAQGKTIVMVTHEPEMAAYATRVIHMRDGKIISDDKKADVLRRVPADTAVMRKVMDDVLVEKRKPYDLGKVLDCVRQATFSMAANKMRSFLSILGILIGVGAVIAMLAIGRGAQDAVQSQLASLGSNLLMVRSGQSHAQGVALQAGSATRLSLQDLAAVAQLPDALRVSPAVNGRVQVVGGGKNANTQVSGVGVPYALMRASVPLIGRFFTDEEYKSRAKVAVIGTTVAQELFADNDPVGQSIRINLINFTVIGVLPPKGANSFQDENDMVIVPATTAMSRLLGKTYIDSMYVEGLSANVLDSLQSNVMGVLSKRHHVSEASSGDAFQIRNMADVKAAMETTTKTMSVLLGAIAAISLLVGGIGIMNIMLVSVTERTREIGLRKAIGASARDIMVQFLVEAVLMSLIGGIAGILLGVGSAALLTVFAGWAVRIMLSSVVLAASFATGVGLVFGVWPARKASIMDPIAALRYE